jgi:predicted transcriptional regulator
MGATMGKLEEVVISALKDSDKALTLAEIAEKISQPEKKVFKELRSLFEKGLIDTENRRYRLTSSKPSA